MPTTFFRTKRRERSTTKHAQCISSGMVVLLHSRVREADLSSMTATGTTSTTSSRGRLGLAQRIAGHSTTEVTKPFSTRRQQRNTRKHMRSSLEQRGTGTEQRGRATGDLNTRGMISTDEADRMEELEQKDRDRLRNMTCSST